MSKRRNTTWTEKEYHEAMEAIHRDQDNQGWFDEPWYLGIEPTKAEIQEMVEDYLPFRWQ
jgi:hypothetical protein